MRAAFQSPPLRVDQSLHQSTWISGLLRNGPHRSVAKRPERSAPAALQELAAFFCGADPKGGRVTCSTVS